MSNASSEERSGALVTYILTALFGIFGALAGWFFMKARGPFARSQTTEALNWAITLVILNIIVYVLTMVLTDVSTTLATILGFVPLVLVLANLILSILGALKAKDGNAYRYPFALRLLK